MLRMIVMSFVLLVTGAWEFAQAAESAQSLLTTELLERIDPGSGARRTPAKERGDALTEADVLKLLPTAYWLTSAPADSENDWVIICAEITEVLIEFTDGKVSLSSATFHPAAKSKDLTLERFRELKQGMTKEEVEKLFGEELSRAQPPETRTQQGDRWRYVRGRELEVYIAKGKVTGALLKAYKDK